MKTQDSIGSLHLPIEVMEFDLQESIKIFDLSEMVKNIVDIGKMKTHVDYFTTLPQLAACLQTSQPLITIFVDKDIHSMSIRRLFVFQHLMNVINGECSRGGYPQKEDCIGGV